MPRLIASAVLAVMLITVFAPVGGTVPAAAQAPGVEVAADAIIVDELGDGFIPRGAGWRDGAGGYGDHHYWQMAVSARTARVGIWRVTLPEAGPYRVEAMVPLRHATTRAARYLIDTADGVVMRTVNQSRTRGTWVSLGRTELGATAEVRLSARTGDRAKGRMVAFDALRFVPVAAPPPPPPPEPPVISTIDVEPRHDRAIVRFSLDAKGPAKTEYRLAGAIDWRLGSDETSSQYADHRQVIDGLRPQTDYELRVIASNAGGRTVSDIVRFTTTAPPPPVISNIDVDPEDTRAVVTFSLDAKGPAQTEYRRVGDSSWIVGADEKSSNYKDHRQVIKNMATETAYELRVVASNAGGRTVSGIVTFKTKLRSVDCDAGGDLAAAVREAKAGDTVIVRGTCEVGYEYEMPNLDKDLTLRGEGGSARLRPPSYYIASLPVASGATITISDIRTELLGINNAGSLRLERVVMTRGDIGIGLLNAGEAILVDTVISDYRRAISNGGSVTLLRSTVTGCGGSRHTGITNFRGGSMLLRDSEVSRCSGALSNSGSMELDGTRFVDNFGWSWSPCGGIRNEASLIIRASTLARNTAQLQGGALCNYGYAEVTGSRFAGNSASESGGAIYSTGDLRIDGTSITGNSAGTEGGGIYNTGTVRLSNVDFSSNVPDDCVGC